MKSTVCPCPCTIEQDQVANAGRFTEPIPSHWLQPGKIIESPGGCFKYEILSYPFSRLYLDFRGYIAYCKGSEIIDTQQRQFWKSLFLLLVLEVARGNLYLPPWLLLGVTGRQTPHLDNNAWEGWPISKPLRNRQGNYLSYYRRLVGGKTIDIFTLRWIPREYNR